ncbi:hypothetical protein JKP88DRAFT_244054 [Tribonema minus]|uniref:Uncharacterized protein n=1 Tax=Tribonema minus TaxID=303371 RepID=A0A835Z3F9_9STRA|nr:hypothetical protein JKP88DRAFT_244054 [Tribonema minus]
MQSRRTVIEGGLHFPPERERQMCETIAKHLSKLGLTVAESACNSQGSGSEQEGDDDSDDSSYAGPRYTKLPATTGVRRGSARLCSSNTGDARNSKNQTGFFGVQGRKGCFQGTAWVPGKPPKSACQTPFTLRDMFEHNTRMARHCITWDDIVVIRKSYQAHTLSVAPAPAIESTSHSATATSLCDLQARLTVIPSGINFSPRQQAAMRKIMTDKVTKELPSWRPTKLSSGLNNGSESTGSTGHRASATSNDDAKHCPPPTTATAPPSAKRQRRSGGHQVQRRARQVQARVTLQLLSAAESMRDAPNDLVVNTIAIVVQHLAPLPQAFQNEPLLAQFVALRRRALEVQVHGESAMQLLTSAERIPQAPTEFVEHIVALAEQELEGL